jgi:hypothetical protein
VWLFPLAPETAAATLSTPTLFLVAETFDNLWPREGRKVPPPCGLQRFEACWGFGARWFVLHVLDRQIDRGGFCGPGGRAGVQRESRPPLRPEQVLDGFLRRARGAGARVEAYTVRPRSQCFVLFVWNYNAGFLLRLISKRCIAQRNTKRGT